MVERLTRRRLLCLSGTAIIAGTAGCAAQSGTADKKKDDTTPESKQSDHHSEDEESNHSEGSHYDGDEKSGQTPENKQSDHHSDSEGTHHSDGHSHDHGTKLPTEPVANAEVLMRTDGDGQHFVPHLVWIEPGGTVTWKLESGQHNAIAYHPDNDKPLRMPEKATAWQFDILSKTGETETHTFEKQGVYDYYCQPHESLGMVGTVIVGKPDPHEQPAMQSPAKSLPEAARTQLSSLADRANKVLGHTH